MGFRITTHSVGVLLQTSNEVRRTCEGYSCHVEVWGAGRGGVGRRAGMELATGARVYVCVLPRRANLLLARLLACLLRFVLSPSQAQDGRGLRLLLNHMMKYMCENRTT